MRKILWMIMTGVSCFAPPVHAQFNTVMAVPVRYKVATASLEEGEEGLLPGTVSARDTPTGGTAVLPVDARKKEWVDRYLSVSYPLQRIKINSSYGYRKDPFSGKRKFHDGIDLHARGDEVLSMMEGVVVKVGQDKASGKYVTLRHGNYTVSYCHLSKVLVGKGAAVRPRDVVGITGSTGRSTGEHLHITCKLNGKSIDPLLVLDYIRSIQEECVSALAAL
ncbi:MULTISPECIES: M23 family metallopeptidase [Bacteroidales]|uniref:M23 family metallopeptidase n=1 Tax=Bacteroidales TaxID=171549 RepID=UPI001F40860D|nr:M23 family metallopeptidase [Bacteroides ovatus]MCE9164050.1 M23 family metallopeptidase [Bacteroides ovatus]